MAQTTADGQRTGEGTPGEVLRAFVPLGLTSFGGPVAHLGYFRTAFVERRRWLSDGAYADLVALCQFMPGPASSQVGLALGLRRGGPAGMVLAWAAFTLPSAVLMAAFGLALGRVGPLDGAGWVLGLKAAAVAVVAHALLGMAGALAATREKATIAAAAAVGVLLAPDPAVAQLVVIAAGGLLGLLLPAEPAGAADGGSAGVSRTVGVMAFALFFAGLVGLPLLAPFHPALDLFDATYRAGALVFGGGHVVLPLLQNEFAGMVDETTFLAGYGAAQAVPGPLFTFAAFLGAVAQPFGGVAGAVVATLGIFAPSVLLVLGFMPFWEAIRRNPTARRALAGVNAAVVGLLAAAFYDPVFLTGVPDAVALAIGVAAFVALRQWGAPPWAVVIAAGVAGAAVL